MTSPESGHIVAKIVANGESGEPGEGAKRLSGKGLIWLRGKDLNLRPLGYEPNELPDCSTPLLYVSPGSCRGQRLLRFCAGVSSDFLTLKAETAARVAGSQAGTPSQSGWFGIERS